MWVANNLAGTVVEIDPVRNKVVRTIEVGEGFRGWPAVRGSSIWFGNLHTGEVVRIDAAKGKVVSRFTLPTTSVEGLLVAGNTLYAAAPDHIYEVDVTHVGAETVTRGLELAPKTGAPPVTLRWGFHSLWAVRADPGELLRIDPKTFEVVGRMAIHGVDPSSLVPIDAAIGSGAVWVRTADRVLELVRR